MFLLSLLALAQASSHFPRQPSLPPSVLLSIVEEDTETFTRAQLARLARLNNSLSSSRQTDSAYFEGDILGVAVQWNNERVGMIMIMIMKMKMIMIMIMIMIERPAREAVAGRAGSA